MEAAEHVKESRGSTDADNVGALIIRIGFWRFLILTIAHYTPKPYSNYSGPYISNRLLYPLERSIVLELPRGSSHIPWLRNVDRGSCAVN